MTVSEEEEEAEEE